MPLGAVAVRLAEQDMFLLPDRYLYWPAQEAILLSDLHLGKATHFRREGVYVPGDILGAELRRLETTLQGWNLKQVFILGDLFHARHNEEWDAFAALLHQWSDLDWHLLLGNHDVLQVKHYEQAGLITHKNTLVVGDLRLGHKPEQILVDLQAGEYGLAGHIHPGYVLRVRGVTGAIKLPCLWLKQQYGILPAWGQFTGLEVIEPAKTDKLYLLSQEKVWPVEKP